MEDVLVPLLMLGATARRRAEFTERLLSAVVPGSVGERLAFTAVVAQQQISSREQAELRMVKEAAARFSDAEDLAEHAPTLHGIYAGLTEAVQATIEFNTESPEQKLQRDRQRAREEQIEEVLEEETLVRKGRKSMISAELIQETESRFAERQAIRQERETKIRAGAVLEADDPERVRKRVQYVARAIIETEGVGLPAQGTGVTALERIMGKNDLMSVRYLELALRVARTVGRVHVRGPDGTVVGYGTGFLISPRLMLTNNHVLTDATSAGYSRVEFDFQEGLDGRLQTSIFVSFDPAAFFTTDKGLDFSLVALKGDVRKIAPYGWNGLSSAEGKIIVGEYVTIIQHPSGERKQLALRENQVVDVLDNYLHYQTDTSPGSSGSPVFNDQWEIVALHHSGVPKKDAQGRILARDGRVYTSSMGENQIDWIANEGVRISRILKYLEGLSLPASQAPLRKQVLESEKGWQGGAAGGGRELGTDELGTESTGNLWSLPLELTIDVGRGASGVGLRAEASRAAPAWPTAPLNAQPPGAQPVSVQPVAGQPAGNGHSADERELASAVAALESSVLPKPAPAAPAESAMEWLVGSNGSGASWP